MGSNETKLCPKGILDGLPGEFSTREQTFPKVSRLHEREGTQRRTLLQKLRGYRDLYYRETLILCLTYNVLLLFFALR